MQNWLLPEYIQDLLPDEAWYVEQIRTQVLNLLRRSGYLLVAPPLLEYTESLLIEGGDEMDLRTFKLVDQLSGRSMALRADITPQVARIDAHLLNHQGITRLCYAGSVLHTQPVGLTRTRELLQIGAELYGHSGLDSDLEVQRLMLETLHMLGIGGLHLDLGHVAVFRALAQYAGLAREMENAIYSALQSKDNSSLSKLLGPLDKQLQSAFMALSGLYGDSKQVISNARKLLPDLPAIRAALNDLEIAAAQLQPQVAAVGIDLADLRGYHYHTGMVFAAYHAGSHDAIALGGRYDELGKSFGRARAATGFSMDLRQLYRLMPSQNSRPGILAPHLQDVALHAEIAQLRESGEIVVVDLAGDANHHHELQCDRVLVMRDGNWQVVSL